MISSRDCREIFDYVILLYHIILSGGRGKKEIADSTGIRNISIQPCPLSHCPANPPTH